MSKPKTAFGENHRHREGFSRIPAIIDVPNLIEMQQNSYESFLRSDKKPGEREDVGLESVFRNTFPISDYNETASLEYVGYEIGIWECNCGEYKELGGPGVVCDTCGKEIVYKQKYDVYECRQKGLTYSDPLRVMVRLIVYEVAEDGSSKDIKDIKEHKVYLGEIPLMTEKGTFIINGTERVIVSQMHRSPGVFFSEEKGKSHHSGKFVYSARLIPYRGSWVDFEFDTKDILHVRIDRRRKFPATILLKAFGYTTSQILKMFYDVQDIGYHSKKGQFFVKLSGLIQKHKAIIQSKEEKGRAKATEAALNKLQKLKSQGLKEIPVKEEDLVGRVVATDVVDESTGEVVLEVNSDITAETLEEIKEKGIKEFAILDMIATNIDNSIRNTLLQDKTPGQDEALIEVYKRLRPGDLPTPDTARILFDNLFGNAKRYDLSKIGRLKLNRKLGLDFPLEERFLRAEDIAALIKYMIMLRQGQGQVDDIDHLGNRRVRSVGELLENQFRIGLMRMERAIKERMSVQNLEAAVPHDLINSKPVTASIKEFFGSSQLSQFMDQTNPLSEITHKRRLSALGPGGLTRERAGFEVRDVHPSHYGRICPIETPEGPNIGLISSLSTYARVNEFGFIETPYRLVKDGVVTGEVEYLSADQEADYAIAQANAPMDDKGRLVTELVSCRKSGDFVLVPPREVDFMDISPKQLVSVSAALIPFLEHDDANRALMGSNMQRQAVPLLKTESPLVGTGMEYVTARDSGATIMARNDGEVVYVDASRVVVRTPKKKSGNDHSGVDIYRFTKYQRSNQNTSINQKPIVRVGQKVKEGQAIADGPATDQGELALGRNVLVAFMPWRGYNFEDAVVISEKVVKEDIYTSIHIQEFDVEARDTKQGKEEITRDIPNVGEEALKNLDESGIIRIGAEVRPGDILVGKVTPKGETQLSPEEKLLKAIFGDKAGDVRDSSLTVPPGVEGVVIDVKGFTRRGVEKDSRTHSIENSEIAKLQRDFEDEVKILDEEKDNRIRELLEGSHAAQDIVDPKTKEVLVHSGKEIAARSLGSLGGKALLKVKASFKEGVEEQIEEVIKTNKEVVKLLEERLKGKIERLKKGDELAPGVIKMVKVYVAMKRKLSVGDKMAGRHGNKGVVAIIVPEEDMPFLPDGTPVELVLNPLGVPSRMNVGQILETYLGWAAKELGTYFSSAVFDGANEDDIKAMLEKAGLPYTDGTILYDGRTGEPFDQKVVVGYIYMMKLHHLVDDKIHARSTGPYSLVTQQPLGGKAQFGGQRLGEMEVWALEAYGAAKTLQEMLTVKSDDLIGRTKMYEAIVKGENTLQAGLPESFNVLIKELQSLALDVELIETDKEE